MKYLLSIWKSLCMLVVLQLGFATAEYCGYYNGNYWYCNDVNTYCCGTNGSSYLCCTYSPFYTWWYFWVGIVGFFFLLSLGIACCRRARARRQMTATRNVNVVNATTSMQVGQNLSPTFNNGGVKFAFSNPGADVPPYAAHPQQYPGIQQQYADPPAHDSAAYNTTTLTPQKDQSLPIK